MTPDGSTTSRRSLLVGAGSVLAAGLAGRAVRSQSSVDDAPETDAAEPAADRVGLVVYNADEVGHRARVAVRSASGTTALSDRRALDPAESARVRAAVDAEDTTEYTVAVDLADGTTVRESIVVDRLEDAREVHAVIHDADRVSVSLVTA